VKQLVLGSIVATAVAGVAGCQTDTRALEQKLDALSAQVGTLSKKVDVVARAGGGGGAAQPSRPARPQPDPAKAYAVPVAGDPSDGPATAKVTIVKAYDYLCPFCERARETDAQIRAKYGDDVRIVYKQYVVHPQAQLAHQAACAAHKQGKFAAMDKLLWDKGYASHQFDDASVAAMAKEAGLDAARFAADVKSDDCAQWLQQERAELTTFGVGSTPAFFINGRYLVGAAPLPAFTQIIDEELAKANQRLAAGDVRAADYYDAWILGKGEKKLASL
jgi:protein-disulfide isomerase